MNMKSLRTGLAAAVGGAVLVAGLILGAAFATAQDTEEADPLDRLFGLVEDLTEQGEAAELDAETLEQIAADLSAEVEPLLDEIREKALDAIDEALRVEALTAEQADRLRERVESYQLPESFPFGHRRFIIPGESECLGFRFGPDGMEGNEDCPDLEFPEGFPFGDDGFRLPPRGFDLRPFEGFLDDLELDLSELREQLESGATLDEALENLGIDLEELAAIAREEALARIDDLVAEGKISEEQADAIREMLEGIDFGEGFPFGMGDFRFDFDLPEGDWDFEGFFGPHGRGHGFGFGGCGDDSASSGTAQDA
jgi:hypothetical protein